MTEDMNLPASLQRLEITHERPDSLKCEENPFSVPGLCDSKPECFLESLSLKASCSKGNCLCNKKRDQEDNDDVLKKLKGIQRKSVVRKSRLHNVVLRAPLLKLNDVNPQSSVNTGSNVTIISGKDSDDTGLTRRLEESGGETVRGGSTRSILRAPILRLQGEIQETTSELDSSTPSLSQREEGGPGVSRNSAALCAIQARNPAPDDTNIEELASYFDLFVHIPKKMSEMAEMMYI